MKWISVEDRLPEEQKVLKVLVSSAWGVDVAFWAKNPREEKHHFYFNWDGRCRLYENKETTVTHWQPLPEAPEGGEG